MPSASVAQLKAAQVSQHDRDRLSAFVAEDSGSPMSLFLQRVLFAAQDGADLSVLADDTEVSPNKAAELLKMSRPHLLTFMDRGDLPFHRVGTHRRIAMTDLLEFMAAREAGAQVLANALGSSDPELSQPSALTSSELDELSDL